MKKALSLLIISLVALGFETMGQVVPDRINYQGRLVNGTSLVNGNVDLTLRIYDDPTAGTLFYEDIATVSVIDGIYSTFIGDNTTFGSLSTALAQTNQYIEVAVNGNTLSPREPLASVAYALVARSVESGSISASAIAPNTFWELHGNSNTTEGADFIGTTDKRAFQVHVNGERAWRVEPSGNSPNFVGGHSTNGIILGSEGSIILAGGGAPYPQIIDGDYSTVIGGRGNVIQSDFALIGGGQENNIQADTQYSTIWNGYLNQIDQFCDFTHIGGGYLNHIFENSTLCQIIGGNANVISSNVEYSIISGGLMNTIMNDCTFTHIGGGRENIIGFENNYASIGNGRQNVIGEKNEGSLIGGGYKNTISPESDYALIDGGYQNYVGAQTENVVIGGGANNTIQDLGVASTISGGYNCSINLDSYGSVIAGGRNNIIGAGSEYGSINGGRQNYLEAQTGIIGGGYMNSIYDSSVYGIIGGGLKNIIQTNSPHAAIYSGSDNEISHNSPYSAVLYGISNVAAGALSVVGGYRAHATNMGSFVWSDNNNYDTESITNNSWTVRCTGGARFISAIDFLGKPSAGVELNSGSGAWTTLSDRNAKEDFEHVDPKDVLERLQKIPVATWKYKTENNTRHIGPMSQDFYAAFQVGPHEKGITTVDADGVAFAAIQGLYQTIQEKNQRLEKELETKQALIDELMRRMDQLSARVEGLASTTAQ